MNTEASSFETGEMLATFLASTPLLSESWRVCNLANANPQQSFVAQQVGSVGYVAFSGVQPLVLSGSSDPASSQNLVPLDSAGGDIFSQLCRRRLLQNEGEEPVMVHSGLLNIFLSLYYSHQNFQTQISALVESSKSIVFTGHSIGGATASLCALWLLSYLQSIPSCHLSVLCITFGSPLLGNDTLSRAILRERWGGNFCHVVSKHDIMPRLLFAPLEPLTAHLHHLMQFWQLCMTSPHFRLLTVQLTDDSKDEIFRSVAASLDVGGHAGEGAKSLFWPFGNYFFCCEDGAVCVDNATSVVKMMHLLFITGSPSCSIEDHLKYGDYVDKVSSQLLVNRSSLDRELPETSYEAGIALALQSSGIACQEPVARQAKECLRVARRMGRAPSLNAANLAIKLSKITPYRAEIEWFKAICDQSEDQMGYYDSFKQRGASKRGAKVNMNRHKLARFWDNVINMLENNQLPHDFHRRAKWVNASQFYKLLVEPLDIAEYYRTGMRSVKGHYIADGRERRYHIFDRWWKDRTATPEESKRSRFASLTQDTLFWARVEEAREWLDSVRSNPRKPSDLWERIECFERYARELVEKKMVSKDVVAKNSSYCLWLKDYKELKSQVEQLPPQFPGFMDGEMVP